MTINLLKTSFSLEDTSRQSDSAFRTRLSPTLNSPMNLQTIVSVLAAIRSLRLNLSLEYRGAALVGVKAFEKLRDTDTRFFSTFECPVDLPKAKLAVSGKRHRATTHL